MFGLGMFGGSLGGAVGGMLGGRGGILGGFGLDPRRTTGPTMTGFGLDRVLAQALATTKKKKKVATPGTPAPTLGTMKTGGSY